MSRKFEMVTSDDEKCATVTIRDEDHTLGNALRYVLSKRKETNFCGYSVPHPSEALINIRLQTDRELAKDVFKRGCEDLVTMCDIIGSAFDNEMEKVERDQAVDFEMSKSIPMEN